MSTDNLDETVLEGISDHIKPKLLDLKSRLDKVEAIVQQIDLASIKELQTDVLLPLFLNSFFKL